MYFTLEYCRTEISEFQTYNSEEYRRILQNPIKILYSEFGQNSLEFNVNGGLILPLNWPKSIYLMSFPPKTLTVRREMEGL